MGIIGWQLNLCSCTVIGQIDVSNQCKALKNICHQAVSSLVLARLEARILAMSVLQTSPIIHALKQYTIYQYTPI